MKINNSFKILILFYTISLQIYSQNQPQHNKKVIKYYAQWAIHARDYNVLDIEADKLTHLMYAFYNPKYNATTNVASIESLDKYADYQHNESGLHKYNAPVKGNIGDLKLLKERYPHLKILISVGGWTKSQNFPAIAASQNARETFAQSMVDFMNIYTWIDGFDIDWEFPLYGGTSGKETINGRLVPAQPHNPDDHKNLVYLLKEMRETFDVNGMTDKEISISMGNSVINVANQFIGPNNEVANNMTENITDYCDFVMFFGYDFGGNWYDKTCYNAPLFGGNNPNDPLHNSSGRNQVLSELIDIYLTDIGIPANKLIVGLPFYGKLFESVASSGIDPSNPGLYETAPRTNNTACNSPQPPKGTWDAVVTPSLNSIIFNSQSTSFNLLNSNVTANFQENLGLIYGTVKKGSVPVANATVSLVLPWADNSHGYKKISKTTNSQGKYFYTATELEGYNNISSLKLEKWDNNSVVYYPIDITSISMPTIPQEFNFNSQPVKPQVSINFPNETDLSIIYGSNINLEALVELSYDDGNTTLSSILFKVDGVTVSNSNNENIYSGGWSPADSDYGATHTFTVEAESSNGESVEKSFEFTLNCMGESCPNIAPEIVWNSPNNTTINQNQGFKNIPIQVTVTDSDGTINSVTITINGNTVAMATGTNNTYTYSFMPSNHQEYPVVITATDSESKSTTYTTTLNIINSQFVPLPSGNIILGYAHSWENSSALFMYFNQMVSTNYNVIMYSFIETVNQNGYTPKLTINSNSYQTNGVFDSQLLKNDINSLRNKGIPVIVSIGGQNGHVELNTVTEKNEFVQGLKNIIDEYGFDGIDLDFEGGSMNFGAAALTDFSYSGISAFPKLKNVVDAFKEIKQHYGSNFILTCAPETFYVQVGSSTYNNTAGAFLPVIHNLRDELDLVMVQLYNTGSIVALDGQAYNQATPDFLSSMSDMLITGFNIASTGFNFPGLPASKIMVGIPSCPASAPAGGYIQPNEAEKALNYLRFKKEFSGRNYALRGDSHPNLRGVMTWSVNWDRASNCASEYEFSTSYHNYFNETLNLNSDYAEPSIDVYPNPVGDILTINTHKKLSSVKIFNIIGKLIFSQNDFQGSNNIIDLSGLKKGLYIIEMKVNSKKIIRKLIKK